MESITLKFPVTVEGHPKVTQLTFRRRKAKDHRRIQAAPEGIERGLVALSCVTDLPMIVIDELDEEDLNAATEVMNGFLDQRDASNET